MAGLTEFYCRLNETSHASQFKWLEYTFKVFWCSVVEKILRFILKSFSRPILPSETITVILKNHLSVGFTLKILLY